MKNFKKSVNLQVKVTREFLERFDAVAKNMFLDRSDFMRMLLSNGLAYWSNQTRKKDIEPEMDIAEKVRIANTPIGYK